MKVGQAVWEVGLLGLIDDTTAEKNLRLPFGSLASRVGKGDVPWFL